MSRVLRNLENSVVVSVVTVVLMKPCERKSTTFNRGEPEMRLNIENRKFILSTTYLKIVHPSFIRTYIFSLSDSYKDDTYRITNSIRYH